MVDVNYLDIGSDRRAAAGEDVQQVRNTRRVHRVSSSMFSPEPIVLKDYRNWFNVRFFAYLIEHSFNSLLTKNLSLSRGFYQKVIFELNIVNFYMVKIQEQSIRPISTASNRRITSPQNYGNQLR